MLKVYILFNFKVIQLGFETTVFEKPVSIQKLDVYVKTGKTR